MAVRSTRTGLATLASGELECRQDILSGRVHHEIRKFSLVLPLSLHPAPLPLLFFLLPPIPFSSPSPSHPLSVPRKLLLCRVTLGKPVEHITAIKIAHAPPGHHSVIGRPSAGGLNYPEYVIYRGEQVNPAQESVLAITYHRSGNFRARNVCAFNFRCVAKWR